MIEELKAQFDSRYVISNYHGKTVERISLKDYNEEFSSTAEGMTFILKTIVLDNNSTRRDLPQIYSHLKRLSRPQYRKTNRSIKYIPRIIEIVPDLPYYILAIREEDVYGINLSELLKQVDNYGPEERENSFKKVFEDTPENITLNIGKRLCEVIAMLHSNSILHLDIRPENIIYQTDFGSFKLIDFSSAVFKENILNYIYNDASLEFSYDYAPEEQIFSNLRGRISVKTDIYSLGKTLLHILYGKDFLDQLNDVNLTTNEKYVLLQEKLYYEKVNNLPRYHLLKILTCCLDSIEKRPDALTLLSWLTNLEKHLEFNNNWLPYNSDVQTKYLPRSEKTLKTPEGKSIVLQNRKGIKCYLQAIRGSNLPYKIFAEKNYAGIPETFHYIELGYEDNITYIAQEYFETNIPLPIYWFNNFNDLTTDDAKDIFLDLCSILDSLHRRGIVHGKLHPNNIFFNKDTEEYNILNFESPLGTENIKIDLLGICRTVKSLFSMQENAFACAYWKVPLRAASNLVFNKDKDSSKYVKLQRGSGEEFFKDLYLEVLNKCIAAIENDLATSVTEETIMFNINTEVKAKKKIAIVNVKTLKRRFNAECNEVILGRYRKMMKTIANSLVSLFLLSILIYLAHSEEGYFFLRNLFLSYFPNLATNITESFPDFVPWLRELFGLIPWVQN